QLSKDEINRQLKLSAIQPKLWFPKAPIRSQRKTKVEFFHELFTGRNLTSLSELWHAIEKISSVRCRGTLQYVFITMLYSCSSMQMFSEKWPSSSRGWTAPRFYLPSIRQEKNVWQAFENRFKAVLKGKEVMNSICKFVRISDSIAKFENSDDNACIYEADFLKFSFPKNIDVNHVFLDPPYNDDIDYMGFSEFWTSWLGLASNIESGWHPGTISIEENAERLLKLLLRIKENTPSSCLITLAYGSKRNVAWELLNKTISKAGYEIRSEIPILWDNPQKRGKTPSTDLYMLLQRASKKAKANDYIASEKDSDELRFFVRVAAFLRPKKSPDVIVELAFNLVKPYLRIPLRQIRKSLIRSWSSHEELNRKAYNRLAFVFIKLILSQDYFRIVSADINQFDDTDITGYDEINGLPKPQGLVKGAAFVAENDKGNRILFCFHDESNVDKIKLIAKRVFENDNDKFREICYLVIPEQKELLMKCRQVKWADKWPRGFFIEFIKLVEKAIELDITRFGHISTKPLKSDFNIRNEIKIGHFKARVLENTPVGGTDDPKHFIVRFQAPGLKYVVPGQFVMVDTLPYNKRKSIDRCRPDRSSYDDTIDLSPKSFLKRPFSIHRAFYKNFKWDYLKNMSLPPALASITHTVFPHEFEIFYKIIENGTGTKELKEMKPGNTFQVLGPLGKYTTVSDLRSDGIEEVHLIGGGVGMAPLMFFGQALRYYSFKIKAFTGIDRLETLYKARFVKSFAEDDSNKAYVYIDNLRRIGLHDNDIYVSFEKRDAANDIDLRSSKINYYNGLVTQQYASYLNKLDDTKNILVITCGPSPMLKELAKLTSKLNIRMKVLLEKRMGCGIGVCMSCVCRTKKNKVEQYSRVCMDGPLFDSEDIVWEKL
ncbi:MAG: hypothetical protein JRJ65_09965, partial [Deltaproteobacteria bacterium]|nr:hypothetical protein [Deltaproteobacteria bacterium]